MIKACIFDMDGTTVNTLDSIAYYANAALNRRGLPSIPTERYKKLVGNGARVLVRRMIDEVGGTDAQFEQVLPDYNSTYDNGYLYLTRPYDGIPEMLDALRAEGVTSVILSNKPDSTAKKVAAELFGDKIAFCLGGREGKALKPDPNGVFELMNALRVSPEECLYIGDTATDMQTGHNAGLTTVGVLWGFREEAELRSAKAGRIVSSPSEITDIVREWNRK